MRQKKVKQMRRRVLVDSRGQALGIGIQILENIAKKPFMERVPVAWAILKGKRVARGVSDD